uniref:Glycosyl transferase 64 domain-containing protein n=1 Tax=Odontella aurita TaxID=265563 RepID=A0A7S4MZZ3_9STRA|mmetsp:Transcript_41888/g.127018  ORF Transcript_41888/g.127018 Transcript_41888/m.127018 type:complete len:382 (+) Transcript_41888:139-1284(+)
MTRTALVTMAAIVAGLACINTYIKLHLHLTKLVSFLPFEMHVPVYMPSKKSFSKTTDKEEDSKEKKDTKSYTIVISSFDRFVELAHVIPHWRSCNNVHEIQIVHHNPKVRFPNQLQNFTMPPLVKVQWYPENKLTNRFRVPEQGGYDTHWIFSVDDDISIDCRTMDAAFAFQQRHPGALVGFEPRLFDWSVKRQTTEGQGYTWYDSCRAETNCSYNTLWTTKGAFLSVHQLQRYWQEKWAGIRSLVDNKTTGEDMLMSTVLATKGPTLSCPTMVRTFYPDKHKKVFLAGPPIQLNSSFAQVQKKGSLSKRTSQFRNNVYQAILAHLAADDSTMDNTDAMLCPAQTTTTWMSVEAANSSNVKAVTICPRTPRDCSAFDLWRG